MNFTLGQTNALRNIWGMLADPEQKFLCVIGPAGTGKTEVIREIANNMTAKCFAIGKLLGTSFNYSLLVTATTNKAVDSLNSKMITGVNGITVFSALKLRPYNGKLVASTNTKLHKTLLIIDEASYIDDELFSYINKFTDNTCKVVFFGDPYQLAPVGYTHAPVFDMGFETIELTEIMRQGKDNPIQALSLALRDFVKGAPLPKLEVDNKHLFHIANEDDFIDTLINSFKQGRKAKLIGFTNHLVTNANSILKQELESTDAIQIGDTLICNKYLNHPMGAIKTDSEVTVLQVAPATVFGVPGNNVTLTTRQIVFCPDDYLVFKDEDFINHPNRKKEITNRWADLRPGYACTIHKSQGSTYQDVFINLDELNSLDDDSLSRLLYVAVSRASDRVYFMGDL